MAARRSDGDVPGRWAPGQLPWPRAPATIRRYAGTLRWHVLPRIGDVPLRDIKPSQVIDVLLAMQRSGLAPASQMHVVQALGVYRMATADDPWLAILDPAH